MIDDKYCCDFGMSLKSMGFHFRRLIVWVETFGNHNSAETNLSPGGRFIHYFSKTDAPLFNPTELREPSARQAVYNDQRANPNGKLPSSVWQIPRITGNNAERVPWQDKGQAPQLPIAVPERCILLASNPHDMVLDPFNGNGTTAIGALRNQRQYIGIDRDQVGLRRAEQWINSSLAQEICRADENVRTPFGANKRTMAKAKVAKRQANRTFAAYQQQRTRLSMDLPEIAFALDAKKRPELPAPADSMPSMRLVQTDVDGDSNAIAKVLQPNLLALVQPADPLESERENVTTISMSKLMGTSPEVTDDFD